MENKSTSSLNWHDIPGYEWLYQFNWHTNEVKRLKRVTIYSDGRKKPLKDLILHAKAKHRTLEVRLSKNRKHKHYSLWRITLLITKWPKPEWMMCCHNDGNIWNNIPENVRYDTALGNALDSMRHWTHIKPMRKVRRSDGKVFESMQSAWKAINKSYQNISAVCRWLRKTAYGFGWEYIS